MTCNFVCRANKADRNGLSPVEMTLSINGKRVFYATHYKEKPQSFSKLFNAKRNNPLQQFCETMRRKAYDAITVLEEKGIAISSENVRDFLKDPSAFDTVDKTCTKLSEVCREYDLMLRKRIDVNLTLCVYQKYMRTFDKFKVVTGDIRMNEICPRHIDEYLITVRHGLDITTANSYYSRLKSFLKFCHENGYTSTDLGSKIKVKKIQKDMPFLLKEELERIEQKDISIERLERVRDLFVFQCHTGCSYVDMQSITKDDIKDSEFGQYIQKQRQKTKVNFFVLIDTVAAQILEKYDYHLPTLTNQKYNSYIRELIDICGISKHVTSHTGRHTFATIKLNEGLPMSIVAKCLGHTSTDLTKHYAKMLDDTILKEQAKYI